MARIERLKRTHLPWFGMPLYDLMELIKNTELDEHMTTLVQEYQTLSKTGNELDVYHVVNKIKANHLVFTKL